QPPAPDPPARRPGHAGLAGPRRPPRDLRGPTARPAGRPRRLDAGAGRLLDAGLRGRHAPGAPLLAEPRLAPADRLRPLRRGPQSIPPPPGPPRARAGRGAAGDDHADDTLELP